VEAVDLEVTYNVPDGVEFNITIAAPATDRRVLISNVNPAYAYPHFQGLGSVDAAVSMNVRTRGPNQQYQSGLVVYLRITDPADTAAYMNLPQNVLAHANDNEGGNAILEGTALSAVPDRPAVYQATSGVNGVVDFRLRMQPPYVAGNNYQVEASFSPTFPAGGSWKSGTLTAWKRVFVEKRRMLRNGLFISADANAGQTSIEIRGNHYGGDRGNDRLSGGDQIVLVHAPQTDRSDILNGWYMETHSILSVTHIKGTDLYAVNLGTGNGKHVNREALLHPYGPDEREPAIGDAIARISGQSVTSADIFDAGDGLVTGLFPDAFTEYIYLSDLITPGASVPVPHFESAQEPFLQRLADKWSSVVAWTGTRSQAALNYQLLIIGDTRGDPGAAGLTTDNSGSETSSYVFRGAINREASQRGVDADVWAMKTAAHEIAHQWRTNSVWTSDDHCPTTATAFDNPALYCLLADYDATGSDTQRANASRGFTCCWTRTATGTPNTSESAAAPTRSPRRTKETHHDSIDRLSPTRVHARRRQRR
jgi:hypothetical protein